jgi:hypothetical protein
MSSFLTSSQLPFSPQLLFSFVACSATMYLEVKHKFEKHQKESTNKQSHNAILATTVKPSFTYGRVGKTGRA